MADYPVLGKPELSIFSGRPETMYPGPFADQALAQARLLFRIATCLSEYPDAGTMQWDLGKNAILAMADALILAQPFAETMASPFQSENIGSYSYSKMTGKAMGLAATAIDAGQPTGVLWFDLAVSQMGVCNMLSSIPMYGGVEIFEVGADFVPGANPHNSRLLGPADSKLLHYFGLDPAPGQRAFGTFSPAAADDDQPWVEDPPGSGLFVPPWEMP